MAELRRNVSLTTVVSTSAGLALATATYVNGVQVAQYMVGDSAWIAILTAGIICILASLGFSELSGMYPTAAGIKLYIEKAFDERTALTLASLYIIVTVGIVGAEAYILGHVLAYAVPAIPPLVWIVFFLTAIALLNIRGIDFAGRTQDVMAFVMFAVLIGFSIYALTRPEVHLRTPFALPGAGNLFNAVAVGIFLFLGFEWVTPLAEEVNDQKLIPRGMLFAIGLLSVTYALFNVAMTATLGPSVFGTLGAHANPIPHILFAKALMGPAGVLLMAGISTIASLTSFNAGLMTASRFLYAIARDKAAPKVLSRIHDRYFTPWVAILVLFVFSLLVSLAVFWSGRFQVLLFMGAGAECMIYAVMAFSVLRLRKKEPDTPRPFRIPGGWVVPAFLGVFFAILMVGAYTQSLAGSIATLAILALMLAYVVFGVPYFRAKYAVKRKSRRPARAPAAADGD